MDISKDSDQSLVKKCFEFCSALTERGCSYSFSLKVGQSFNFTLKSGKGTPPKAKPKRSPSYFRRQLRRREDFLKRRSGSSEKDVDADLRHNKPNQNEKAEESSSDDSESESGSNPSEPENKQEEQKVDPTDDHWSPVPPVSSTSSFPNFYSYRFEYQRRKKEERRTIDPWTGRPRVSIVDTYKRHMIKEHRMQGGRGSFVYHCVFAPADIARADVERETLTPNSTKLKEINGTYGNQEFSSDGIFHLTGSEIFPQKDIWS